MGSASPRASGGVLLAAQPREATAMPCASAAATCRPDLMCRGQWAGRARSSVSRREHGEFPQRSLDIRRAG